MCRLMGILSRVGVGGKTPLSTYVPILIAYAGGDAERFCLQGPHGQSSGH